jgi:hypothetical protein
VIIITRNIQHRDSFPKIYRVNLFLVDLSRCYFFNGSEAYVNSDVSLILDVVDE